MSVVVVGLNHRTVPLELLERMTVDPGRLPKALHDLASRDNLSEAVVLSTCNRTEVYALAERFHGGVHDIRCFLGELAFLPPEEFADSLYVFHDGAAADHLFSVAAGIDSAVVGESEILGQVRSAWERAQEEGTSGSVLNLLFRHALQAGKRARSETAVGRHTASVSHAAVALASDQLGGLEGRSVLVLGAGEMGERMLSSVMAAGVSDFRVANRTWTRAVELADRLGGTAVPLAELPDSLAEVDVLLTSTGASSIMVDQVDLEPALARRGGRPLLVVDVAVPRDVDPSVGTLPGVTLLDMDDLRRFAEAGIAERRKEIGRVREIVGEEVERYLEAASARRVAPLVVALREKAEQIRAAEVERAGRGLDPDTQAALEVATRSLVAKLLHEPTVRMKDATGSARGDRLADAMRDLFDL